MNDTIATPEAAGKVFISYSRVDVAFADELELALKSGGFETLVDRHGIDAGEDWKTRLGELIFACDTVVFILTDTSACSSICAWEVEEAARLGKRMLVVTLGPVPAGLSPPPHLAGIKWIHCWRNPAVPGSSQTKGFLELDKALRTDVSWLRQRTIYQEQASRWFSRGAVATSPLLLRGHLIAEAQAWAQSAPRRTEVPSEIEQYFAASGLLESRLAAEAAEAMLRKVSEHLRVIAQAARGGIWTWGVSDADFVLSQEAAEILNYESVALPMETLVARAREEDRIELRNAFAELKAGNPFQLVFRLSDDKPVWLEMRGAYLQTSDDDSSEQVLGSLIDVTAQKEADLRSSALARRLRAAIESFSGPFALWDARKRLILWNKKYAELTGIGPELLRIGATYDAVHVASAARIRREQHDTGSAFARQIELIDGTWIRIVEQKTEEGGLVLVALDITEQKHREIAFEETERKLRSAVEQLEESDRRHSELLARLESLQASKAREEQLRVPTKVKPDSKIAANRMNKSFAFLAVAIAIVLSLIAVFSLHWTVGA